MPPREIMRFARVIDVRYQMIFVDGIEGFSFSIPDKCDGHWYDVIDSIKELPLELDVMQIHVF